MSEPVTVITGARKGIGRFLCEHYLSAGHRVIGVSRETSDLSNPSYTHICADVTDEGAIGALFTRARKEYQGIHHLINCAAVASMNHALLTPGSSVRRILETNVLGTFLCSREAAKLMQRQKWGRIVNFSSVAVPFRIEGEAAYAASKSAVVGLTETLARELAPMGITVNAVGPGPVDTDLIRNVPSERLEALVARQAVKRRSTLQDVAHVVDFLFDRRSEMVTGQVIYLGGL